MLVVLLALLLAVLVLGIVTTPLRRLPGVPEGRTDDRRMGAAAEVENLEAERDAKYREIRDAELDRQTGHLSDADFAVIDSGLRAEAIELLKQLDRARKRAAKLEAESEADTPPADRSDADPVELVVDPDARYHHPRT